MTNKTKSTRAVTIYNADLPPLDADFKKHLKSWSDYNDKTAKAEGTLSDTIRAFMLDGLEGKQQLEQGAYWAHKISTAKGESYRALINRLSTELFNKGKVDQLVRVKSSKKGAKKEIVPVEAPTKEQAEQKIADLAEKTRNRQQKQAEDYLLGQYESLSDLRAEFARIEELFKAANTKAS